MEKLQWKTTHTIDFSDETDFLETMLHDYGVTDIETFLHPNKKNELDSFLMPNMDKAIKLLHDFLQTDKKLFIKGDCDVDGATSLAILVQFIRDIKPQVDIIYKTDYNKKHGLCYSDIKGLTDIGLIIVPDASVTIAEMELIKKDKSFKEVPVLVLDHHELNEEMDTKISTIVNCMDEEYPNHTLSGAGVVYKFAEAYCDTYNLDRSIIEKYIDLVAVGIIADSMDLRNPETRYFVFEGLKEQNYHNQFLNELQELFAEDMKFGRTITSVGWVIAPKINGAIRYGKHKEQDDLFRAICGEQEDIEYQPRRAHASDPKPDIEIQSLQKTMARVAKNIKARQDTEVRKFVTKLEDEIQKKQLDQNSVLFIDGSDLVEKSTVTGLIANKLASKYHRPVILLKSYTDEDFGGSGRGYDKGNIENFKELIDSLGVFSFTGGHQSAFGIQIPKNKVEEAIKLCNEKIPFDSLCTVYPVDWEIDAKKLKTNYVKEVAENYNIWGNSVPEPVFAIKDLHINASNITGYGDNNTFIRFIYKGIPFIKKYCLHTDFEEMTCWDRHILGKNKKDLTLNLICQFVLNSWEDKVTPQIKILYFDSQVNVEKIGINDSGNKVESSVSKSKKKESKKDDWIEEDTIKEKKTKIKDEEEFDDFVF